MSAYKGFKEFGEQAVAATMKELVQLDQGAMPREPLVIEINPDQLTQKQKKKAFDTVNIMALKRDDRVKGQACANGSKQKIYLKEYKLVASPTVSL